MHQLQLAVAQTLRDPEFQQRIVDVDITTAESTPDSFAADIQRDQVFYREIVKAIDLRTVNKNKSSSDAIEAFQGETPAYGTLTLIRRF